MQKIYPNKKERIWKARKNENLILLIKNLI